MFISRNCNVYLERERERNRETKKERKKKRKKEKERERVKEKSFHCAISYLLCACNVSIKSNCIYLSGNLDIIL